MAGSSSHGIQSFAAIDLTPAGIRANDFAGLIQCAAGHVLRLTISLEGIRGHMAAQNCTKQQYHNMTAQGLGSQGDSSTKKSELYRLVLLSCEGSPLKFESMLECSENNGGNNASTLWALF